MKWHELASETVAGMEAETETHEKRKAFYRGDGVARAQAMVRQLDTLRQRLAALIRAD